MEILLNPETHEYTVDGQVVVSVTQVLKAEGFIDTFWFNEHHATRGSYVHHAAHLYDKGTLDEDSLDPALVPYLDAYKRFLADSGFQVMESEVMKYSASYQVCGTPDKKGILNGRLTRLDLKSGDPQEWAKVQLAGYDLIDEPCDNHTLWLRSDGTYRLGERIKITPYRNVFISALTCYHFKNRRK